MKPTIEIALADIDHQLRFFDGGQDAHCLKDAVQDLADVVRELADIAANSTVTIVPYGDRWAAVTCLEDGSAAVAYGDMPCEARHKLSDLLKGDTWPRLN